MTPNQIGALTTLIFVAVFYLGTPLWADRRGRNWKLWLVLAFLFPVISLIVLFLLPNKKAKGRSLSAVHKEEGKLSALENVKSSAIPEQEIQTQPILDTAKRINEVISSEPSDDAMDDVLADFEDMLMSKSVLHGLGIKGLVGVRLQAEKYDDDGAESFKCWIIVESTAIKKLSDDLNEQVSDTVQDFVRENDFDSAISEAGFDPDLFNWWPVRVENVGVATAAKDVPDASKEKTPVATNSSAKKSYTEDFKKEVVHTALTAGTSLSEIARMYEINLTLVRNWKAKYGAEILKEINGDEDNDGARSTQDVEDADTVLNEVNGILADFDDLLDRKNVLNALKIDGLLSVYLQAERYSDDGSDAYKVWIVLESDGVKKISADLDEQVQDIVYDFINDNGFSDAMTEAGYDPELFNWWPVRIDYVGRDETAESGTDELSEPSSSIEKISIVNLIDKFNDLIGAEIEGIENKLYERGMLKKLTGDANAQVSVWLTTHGEGDTYISLYVDIESEKAKIEVSYSEEFTDYISGKFHEAVDELSKEDNDALNDNFFGVVVRLNNEEI